VDHHSRFPYAFPIKDKTSKSIKEVLQNYIFPEQGYPNVLVTDNGMEFCSNDIETYFQQMGIEHRTIRPYWPQTNGLVEPFNGTLKHMITKLVNNQPDKWEEVLPHALMCIRNGVNVTTGHTPFYVMYGRRARLPMSQLLKKNTSRILPFLVRNYRTRLIPANGLRHTH
jgi:transposase InsO family protein